MPILIDGFSGKRLYAISPATRFAAKLSTGGPYRPLPTRLNIYTKTVSTFVFSKVPRVFSKVLTVFTKVLTVLRRIPERKFLRWVHGLHYRHGTEFEEENKCGEEQPDKGKLLILSGETGISADISLTD